MYVIGLQVLCLFAFAQFIVLKKFFAVGSSFSQTRLRITPRMTWSCSLLERAEGLAESNWQDGLLFTWWIADSFCRSGVVAL